MAKIFISYARKDGSDAAQTLTNRLRDLNHEVFIDIHGIPGGVEWEKELIRRARWCDTLLIVVTQESSNSQYVYQEFREAEKNKKLIIPLLADDTPLPLHLSRLNALKFDPHNVDNTLLKIENSIRIASTGTTPSRGGNWSLVGGAVLMIAIVAVLVYFVLSGGGDDEPGTSLETESTATATQGQASIAPPILTQVEISPPILTQVMPDPTLTQAAAIDPTTTVAFSMPTVTVARPTVTATSSPTPASSVPPVSANADWEPVEMEIGGAEMVLVPPGCFGMGTDDEESDEFPVHEQCFAEPFWIDKFEVTNLDFGTSGEWNEDDYPREMVSWFDASVYCLDNGKRLPSEAEWEYAARGPSSVIYPWGDEFVAENSVYWENSEEQPAPVGSRPDGASWVGALDIGGNLWEWTSTIYASYPYVADDGREDGINSSASRVIRGGSWSFGFITTYDRFGREPDNEENYIGFRCVRDYRGELD